MSTGQYGRSLRSSRQRATVFATPFVADEEMVQIAHAVNPVTVTKSHVDERLYLLPVNPAKEERRERRRKRTEKLNKPLPEVPPSEVVQPLDAALFLPRRVCKHLHRLVTHELPALRHRRYREVVREFRLVTPQSAVRGILEGRRYHALLDEILKDADPDRYYATIDEVKAGDQVYLLKLVNQILYLEAEKEEALDLEENDSETLMQVFQEVLDSACLEHDDERSKLKKLMSLLTKRSSGLPDSMFISGVSLARGQASIGGTFGDIYKTMYQNQPVALKFLRIYGSSPEEKRKTCKKFYKEARVWQKLDYKYVLPFLGVDTENFPGRPCLVSPWMVNGNAHQFVKTHPKINVDKLLFEIAQGIQYLHSKLVVHGDIKGVNIMIDEQWHPRLADFGLTIWADATRQDTTQHGGTVRWMAPELLYPTSCGQEDSQRTFATDVYAYGCVCLELYTRENPFHEVYSEGAVSMKVARGERPERPKNPPFHSDLWALVTACWHRDPQMRPGFSEIVEGLKSILRKSAVEGGLDSLFKMRSRISLGDSSPKTTQPSSFLSGAIHEEPAEMNEDIDVDRGFDEALLQIREHSDPFRSYPEPRRLQRGFSIQVLFAKTKDIGTPVTIKLIHLLKQSKARIVEIIDEYMALRFLHDANIVGYLDMFRFKNYLWVIQDDVSNTNSLKTVLKAPLNRDLRKREHFLLSILPRILKGLDHLHRHGVVHGYVGIDDIIFNKDAHVRLRMCAMIRDQQTIQRPRPSAPEIIEGQRYGPKADIWNLGLLLIEAFDIDEEMDLDQTPDMILSTFKGMFHPSSTLREIVTVALELDWAERPSAGDLLTVLSTVNLSQST